MGQSLKLRPQVLSAPDKPGVYLMRDHKLRVLYIGKANSLKKRLLSYLRSGLSAKTLALIQKVARIEFRITADERMALLLESRLIHEFKPQYNISLKDDKSFPWVEISGEEFPVVRITRKKNNPLSRYLGPYTNAKLLKSVLKVIRLQFPYRSCSRLPQKSCIYHRINLCPGPCLGEVTTAEYRGNIDNIILILKGQVDLLIRKLSKSMQESSQMRDFEAAARKRDQITALSAISSGTDTLIAQNGLDYLGEKLGLRTRPLRIEGFDVSNLSGRQAVGSMVSFYQGRPDKSAYRRYRIKSCLGIDDYKMLAELVRRRYTRLLAENKPLPDLLMIDGGKGHLLTARGELKALNLDIPLISIAKEKENIYVFKQGRAVVVSIKSAPALNLIRRIRDEAHRFALTYHRLLRKKALVGKCRHSP